MKSNCGLTIDFGILILDFGLKIYNGHMKAAAHIESSVEDAVYARASKLLKFQNAWAEELGGRKLKDISRDLAEIVRIVRRTIKSVDGAYGTFIGGLAVQELGYERYTNDADVVIDSSSARHVMELLREKSFDLNPNFTLVHRDSGAILDVLREGCTLKDSRLPLPHPSELGPNVDFASLHGVIRLKLDTGGRMKDLADIVELLKRRMNEADSVRAKLPEILREDFDKMVAQAHREMR